MFNKRKGQSTVEYIVLVTAVLGTLILFLNGPSSPFRQKVNDTLTTGTDQMDIMATRLTNAQALTNGASPTANYTTKSTTGLNCDNGINPSTGLCL